MCINRTFSELNGAVVNNGTYSVRYVMENDSPRFVLVDIVKALGYKSVSMQTNYFCRKLGLGKVVGADNRLRTYATKEQVDLILDKARYTTDEFRAFWEDEVVPATDEKYAALRKQIVGIRNEFKELKEINDNLIKENKDLTVRLEHLVREREAISNILSMTA